MNAATTSVLNCEPQEGGIMWPTASQPWEGWKYSLPQAPAEGDIIVTVATILSPLLWLKRILACTVPTAELAVGHNPSPLAGLQSGLSHSVPAFLESSRKR